MISPTLKAVPDGYGAICKRCQWPYTFQNAKALKVQDWKRYCSNICANKTKGNWCKTCGHKLK